MILHSYHWFTIIYFVLESVSFLPLVPCAVCYGGAAKGNEKLFPASQPSLSRFFFCAIFRGKDSQVFAPKDREKSLVAINSRVKMKA